ncbi:MAG: rhodanese-like domain-containing protein [Myxococcales bacterium]|nr:rhodanese-like domain-containing protein [Myxococcales bacterium]
MDSLMPVLAFVGVFVVLMGLRALRSGPVAPIEVPPDGKLLLDVRSPTEFRSGHLKGAVNLPLGAVAAQAERLGAKDREIVLYCRSGNRSGMALQQLRRLGFTNLKNLGGVHDGPRQGYPLA